MQDFYAALELSGRLLVHGICPFFKESTKVVPTGIGNG